MITKKAEENAAQTRSQIHDDEAPARWISASPQLECRQPRCCLDAGTYATMGVGLDQAIAAATAEPDRPVVHLSGGFSGMKMETLVPYNFPGQDGRVEQWAGSARHPRDPGQPDVQQFNMKPNALIYGAPSAPGA
ncbi:MAG: hypothetical protein JO229_07245 [Alphaproteobacteria bacterium]|nr:hypothetical protein [Alphaproteobacteria bacterium]